MTDEAPDCCHLSTLPGSPVRTSPSVSIPAGFLRRVLLRKQNDDVVLLSPRTEPSMGDEREIEAMPSHRGATVEGGSSTVEEHVEAAGRSAAVGFAAAAWRHVRVAGARKGHVFAAGAGHPERQLIKRHDVLWVDRA